MEQIIMVLGAAILVAVAVIVFIKLAAMRAKKAMPYVAVGPLLSAQEIACYEMLKAAVGSSAVVLAKVRVVDVIKPRSGLKSKVWRMNFDRIVQKEFDFVVCDAADMSVLYVFEMDTASQQNDQRQSRNEFLLEACEAAEVEMFLIDASDMTSVADFRNLLGLDATEGEAIEWPESSAADQSTDDQVVEYSQQPEPQQRDDYGLNDSDRWQDAPGFSANDDEDDGMAFRFNTSESEAEEAAGSDQADQQPDTSIEEQPASDDSVTTSPDSMRPVAEIEPASGTEPQPVAAGDAVAQQGSEAAVKQPEQGVVKSTPPCPKCGSALNRRTPKSGKFAGQALWICSCYPDCKFAAPVRAKAAEPA